MLFTENAANSSLQMAEGSPGTGGDLLMLLRRAPRSG